MADTDEQVEKRRQSMKEHNESLRRDKLQRRVNRAHEWRVQVWAQMELKIRADNAALQAMGAEPVELFEPQFGNDDMLNHYSSMTLTK